MFRITLLFDDMTWADLRAFVALNERLPGNEPVGIDTDLMSDDVIGLYEYASAEDVMPRG